MNKTKVYSSGVNIHGGHQTGAIRFSTETRRHFGKSNPAAVVSGARPFAIQAEGAALALRDAKKEHNKKVQETSGTSG